jgi:hypothetical protein
MLKIFIKATSTPLVYNNSMEFICKKSKNMPKITLYLLALWLVSTNLFAQAPPVPPETSAQKAKNQLIKACEANFSGSTNQADDCLLCAKKASDINSRKFNSCMSSGSDLYLPSIDDPLEELVPKKKK